MCTLRIDIDPGLVFEYCHPLWLLLITAMVIMIILTTTRAAALNLNFITQRKRYNGFEEREVAEEIDDEEHKHKTTITKTKL